MSDYSVRPFRSSDRWGGTLEGQARARGRIVGGIAALVALSLMGAACSSDDDDTSSGGSDSASADGDVVERLDANGDGKIVIGVATPGPRDDGAYYQSLVDGVTALSEEQGFEEPLIVDEIPVADAATQLTNLARQGPDIIAVGASEIADGLADVASQYPDIFWYCNCGAGTPEDPNYAQSQDDASEINFTAGYATGLLMRDGGTGTAATFVGNQGFDFEVESSSAFLAGLQEVDPSYTLDIVNTGSFDDVAAASEAANTAIDGGTAAIYPFLGGALESVVQVANDADVITMSAGASDVCDRDDLEYQIAVRFDAADYLDTVFAEIISGDLEEGEIRQFKVGVDEQPGAVICDATPEQQTAMDDIYTRIADGEFTEAFGEIKAEAYGG
jgi:basic membrane protein A and related proteins